MEKLIVRGGRRLCGQVRIPGAKNSALPLLAASLLCSGPVLLENVPQLADVEAAVAILRSLGSAAAMKRGCVALPPVVQLRSSEVPPELMAVMRSSVFFLAPLLARTGAAYISVPGGCKLGARPIDIHLGGLSAMGAQVQETPQQTRVTAPHGLHGADYTLRFPSVGATETLLMAAVLARGETTLRGVATEPEIQDLARFLQCAGARIAGEGTSVLRILGVPALHGARYTVCPDRIVAATVLCAVAACSGDVLLTKCVAAHQKALVPFMKALGCRMQALDANSIYAYSDGPCKALGVVETGVFPAFCTDAAPLLAAATLRARGETRLHDTIFESRFSCATGFTAMGARVQTAQATLAVRGVPRLHAANVCAQDLRGGAALVLAALQAQGESEITGLNHIRRGYADIAGLFAPLGAALYYKSC